MSFGPISNPERLTATGGKHPAKKIAAQLHIDADRARECLQRTPDDLRTRATKCGLPEFIDELTNLVQAVYLRP